MIEPISTRISPTAYQRSFLFFARHRAEEDTKFWIQIFGQMRKVGVDLHHRRQNVRNIPPWNACRPVNTSSSTRPKARISLR